MKFKATEQQVKEMAVNAVKASAPMGMGFLHYNSTHEFEPEMFEISKFGLELDYVHGRMVKLTIKSLGNGEWQPMGRSGDPTPDYQSWVRAYPKFEDLLKSVGITEVTE